MTIEKILEERGKRYGEFPEHARISQNIKQAMKDSPNWCDLSDDKKEALTMIGHKIARILNGDTEYQDNWTDIVGYSKLVADGLAPKSEDFKIGDHVRKKSGSEWEGFIVGSYSTELTHFGYAVESSKHKGSVQIYPYSALELI